MPGHGSAIGVCCHCNIGNGKTAPGSAGGSNWHPLIFSDCGGATPGRAGGCWVSCSVDRIEVLITDLIKCRRPALSLNHVKANFSIVALRDSGGASAGVDSALQFDS